MPKTDPEYVERRYLSISTLIRYARCPRLYFYEKCGLRPGEPALAPEYGSAMHIAVPVALETEDVDAAMEAFMGYWAPFQELMEARGEIDKKRNPDTARRSLMHYVHKHQGRKSIFKLMEAPEGALPMDDKTSKYEVPWAIDIGLKVPLVGRFDAFCRHRDTGDPWIWELKTASQMGPNFFNAHEMSPQNLVYCLVGQTLLQQPIEGVMVEGMLVHATKIDNDIALIPTQDHHVEDIFKWLHVTGGSLLAAEKAFLESGNVDFFPKNFCGCTPYTHYYWPGWRCDYADLCRVPDWRVLTDMFRVVEDHDFLSATVDVDAAPKAGASK